MADSDDSTAKEIARTAARVLPLVGEAVKCPRWLLWLAAPLLAMFAVVLYVVAKRLVPDIARWWVENRVKLEPPPPLGAHQAPTDIPDGSGWVAPTPGEPGGGPAGGSG